SAPANKDATLDASRLDFSCHQDCEIRIVVGMPRLVRADIQDVVPLRPQVFSYRLFHIIAGVVRSNYNFHANYLAYKTGDGRSEIEDRRRETGDRISAIGMFHGAFPEFDKLTGAA